MKWKLILMGIIELACISLHAQTEPAPYTNPVLFKQNITQTPEASEMIRSITHPVNYMRGIPEIKIPIYDIQCGEILLPIYLSYDASGIKVADPSGRVGQGWSLTAEPVINRQIRGRVDTTAQINYFNNLYNDYSETVNYLCNLAKTGVMDFYPGTADEAPDEFFYRLSDKSGKFMYSEDERHFKPIPYDNVLISGNLNTFTLIDDKGVTYSFGGMKDTIQISDYRYAPTSWKCSSIITSNTKDTISFRYQDESESYSARNIDDNLSVADCFTESMDEATAAMLGLQTTIDYEDVGIYDNPTPSYGRSPYLSASCSFDKKVYRCRFNGHNLNISQNEILYMNQLSKTFIHKTHELEEILFKGNKVLINYDLIETSIGNLERISDIQIINYNNEIIRQISFDYIDTDNNRYFLKELSLQDGLGNNIGNYQFTYYTGQGIDLVTNPDGTSGGLSPHPGGPIIPDPFNPFNPFNGSLTNLHGPHFAYNTNSMDNNIPEEDILLPDINSRMIDFWGYYNGVSSNDTNLLIPRMYIKIYDRNPNLSFPSPDTLRVGSRYYKSRASNEKFMQIGSLKTITYPTGGTDEFIYEANRIRLDVPLMEDNIFRMCNYLYADSTNNDSNSKLYQIGGLRIKQIISKTGEDAVTRTFTYGRNEDGEAISPIPKVGTNNYFLQTRYGYFNNSFESNNFWNASLSPNVQSRSTILYSSPVVPMTFDGGIPAMYDCVTEYRGTEDNNVSKTVYCYDIPTYKQSNNPESNIPYYESEDWKSCDLLSKTVFENNGTSYVPKYKETYSYYLSDTLYHIRTGKVCQKILNAEHILNQNYDGNELFIYQTNILNVSAKRLARKQNTFYINSNDSVTSISDYGYLRNDLTYPTSKINSFVTGEIITEDYTYPSMLTNASPYSDMVNKNIVSPVICTTVYNGSNKVSETKTQYGVYGTNYLPNSVWKSVGNDTLHSVVTVTDYDDYGNIQGIQYESEKLVILWGYRHSYPIALIQGCTFSDIKNECGDSFIRTMSEKDQPSENDFATLKGAAENIGGIIETYTYDPLIGKTSVVSPFNHKESYNYDSYGRLSDVFEGDINSNILQHIDYQYINH